MKRAVLVFGLDIYFFSLGLLAVVEQLDKALVQTRGPDGLQMSLQEVVGSR